MYDVIYLIPDENSYVWCEDPAPGIGMEEEDAIKYIRADLVEKRKAQQKDAADLPCKKDCYTSRLDCPEECQDFDLNDS